MGILVTTLILIILILVFFLIKVTSRNNNGKLAQILKQAPMTIVITDLKGRIEYANPFFTRLTGYTSEEVMGKNMNIFNTAYHPKEYYRQMWGTILSGKEWSGEFRNKTKNGDLYWEWATIGPLKDPDGRFRRFISIKENITEKKQQEGILHKLQDELKSLSLSDPLTGLYNRRGFETLAGPALRIIKRSGQPAAVFFIDIDNMKIINDAHGHAAGDHTLVEMAQVLKNCFRESDIIARFGGDEFVVFMPGMEQGAAENVVRRFKEKVEERGRGYPDAPRILWSLGAAYDTPIKSLPLHELIQEADRKMYANKISKKQG